MSCQREMTTGWCIWGWGQTPWACGRVARFLVNMHVFMAMCMCVSRHTWAGPEEMLTSPEGGTMLRRDKEQLRGGAEKHWSLSKVLTGKERDRKQWSSNAWSCKVPKETRWLRPGHQERPVPFYLWPRRGRRAGWCKASQVPRRLSENQPLPVNVCFHPGLTLNNFKSFSPQQIPATCFINDGGCFAFCLEQISLWLQHWPWTVFLLALLTLPQKVKAYSHLTSELPCRVPALLKSDPAKKRQH